MTNKRTTAKTTSRSLEEETPRLRQIYHAATMVEHSTTPDPVSSMQFLLCRWAGGNAGKLFDLLSDGQVPGYTEIVLALYNFLTRTYLSLEDQRMIFKILDRCSNHEFTRFVRLANRRRNPNGNSRVWANIQLAAIAKGDKTLLGGYGARWQRGAKWWNRKHPFGT